MGIQPIDLQSMYSQISNVAKAVGGQQQTAQLNESMQQQTVIQKNLENAAKVQQTSAEKNSARNVDSNGSNGSFYAQSRSKKQNQDSEDEDSYSENQTKEHKSGPSYLGTIIDITG